jgi:hypothetical protein
VAKNKATSSESKGTIHGLNHYHHSYKRKQHQKKKSMRNNANNNNGRTSTQQPTDCQTPQHEPMNQDNFEKEPNLTSKKHCPNPQVSANTNTNASDRMNHTDQNTTQHTPTIVNGEASETTSSKVKLFNANNKGSMKNIMDELKKELTNQRKSYSIKKKCVGDSHTRDFTNMLKTLWVITSNSTVL